MNRMGCLSRLGCLTLLALCAVAAWLTRDRWLPQLTGRPVATAAAPVWESLTPAGAERARKALERLSQPSGAVFANLSAGEIAAYVYQSLAKELPASADSVEAMVVGDRLYIRALVQLRDLGGTATLGPLAAMLGDRERMQFGGTLHVIRPELAEFQVKDLKLRDFSVPQQIIPRLLAQIERGARPAGLSPDGLPIVIPRYLGDVRIANGKVTLYKNVGP